MKHRFAKTLLTIAAGLSVGLGAAIPAQADTIYNPGTGGTGGGTGGTGTGPSHYVFVLGDNLGRRANPVQGWGQASTNYYVNRLNAFVGGEMVQKQIHEWADPACNTAMQRAIARSGGKAKKARVVGLYMGVRKTPSGKWASWGGLTAKNMLSIIRRHGRMLKLRVLSLGIPRKPLTLFTRLV